VLWDPFDVVGFGEPIRPLAVEATELIVLQLRGGWIGVGLIVEGCFLACSRDAEGQEKQTKIKIVSKNPKRQTKKTKA
jgi:hypothetical protein